MEDLVASRTALATALIRSLHTRSDPLPLINDSWGERLVPAEAIQAMQSVLLAATETENQGTPEQVAEAMMRGSSAYTNVITRTRYTEDALQQAMARGVRQYVLIGAGFDSYSLRRPPQAEDLEIFEIDHPATQALKRQQMIACEPDGAARIHYLPADLGKQGLHEVLAGTDFEPGEAAFFSWLGVSMYLPREANMSLLRTLAEAAASGSELVFTYVDQCVFDLGPSDERYGDLQRMVSALGEPFLSGFHPSALGEILCSVGLELEEDLDEAQLVARYDPQGENGLRPVRVSHIVRARVP